MSISGMTKAGYFLVGLGIGLFGGVLIFKHELDKPVGEIEEYIPLEDREGFDDKENDISNDENNSEVSGNGSRSSEGSKESDISSKHVSGAGNSDSRRGFDELSRRSRRPSNHRDREEDHKEFASNKAEILDYYRSTDSDATRVPKPERVKRFDSNRYSGENGRPEAGNQTTRYSRMYQDEVIESSLHAANSKRNARDSYDIEVTDVPLDDDYDDDMPEAEIDIHEEFVLERVDEYHEIFLDDNPQDFITMIFYEGDNTLCDDGEQIVPEAEDVIGEAALSRLIQKGPGAEDGIIFVHNLKSTLNYEVVLDAGSYRETVMGIFENRHNGDGGRGASS